MSLQPLVYFIDDDPSAVELLKMRFTKLGCEPHSFSNPQELIDAVKAKAPALVMVDLNLGEFGSGFHIISELRTTVGYADPILVFSGDKQNENVAHALELGATDYLVKSPAREDFTRRVAAYLSSDTSDLGNEPLRPLTQVSPAMKVGFTIRLLEVHSVGFTLLTDHLVKKGTSLWLKGQQIQAVCPSSEKLFVTVVRTELHDGPEGGYHVRVAIDPDNETASTELRAFLNQSKNRV